MPFRETWSATFHRDEYRNVAIGTKTGNVVIWDTKNKSIAKTFPAPPEQCRVNLLSYNVKNTSLAATMQNGETIIYGLVSNIPVQTVKLACSRSISRMKFHPESRSLLGLATDEGHMVLRDIATNKDKTFLENVHASPVSDFVFSHINKDVMLSCGYDKVMHVYDISVPNVVSTIKTPYILTSIAVNPQVNHQVALGTQKGVILVYDLRDLTIPFKVLKDHKDEVRRVCFQPSKKKTKSVELSLREENKVHSPVYSYHSPMGRRTSDMFLVNDSPPRTNVEVTDHSDNRADSFLAMMGLDKTNTDTEVDVSKCSEFEVDRGSHHNGFDYLQNIDKNISKVSTPLNSKPTEHFALPSPICPMNMSNMANGHLQTFHTPIKQESNDLIVTNKVDNKTMNELKDFIKLTMAEVADSNKDYFLRTMIVLTKQKLYLEKQLANMSDQMQSLVQNQNALVETNRKLALEIDKLKMAQQYPL